MDMQSQKYQSARTEAEKLYASFGKEKCPALNNEFVYFTSEGFNHLVYQTKKKPRDERVQITKFSLLSKAKQLLAISTTYQEYEEDIKPVKVRRHKKILHESALIKYWGLIAIIGKTRIKVVVRQTGDGKKEFYSVIPAWVARNYREIKLIENTVRGGLIDEDDAETLKNATEK